MVVSLAKAQFSMQKFNTDDKKWTNYNAKKRPEKIRRNRVEEELEKNWKREREREREQQQKTILLCDLQFKTFCMCCHWGNLDDSLSPREWDMLMRHLLCCIFAARHFWPCFSPTHSSLFSLFCLPWMICRQLTMGKRTEKVVALSVSFRLIYKAAFCPLFSPVYLRVCVSVSLHISRLKSKHCFSYSTVSFICFFRLPFVGFFVTLMTHLSATAACNNNKAARRVCVGGGGVLLHACVQFI